jgi:hypothetical protein
MNSRSGLSTLNKGAVLSTAIIIGTLGTGTFSRKQKRPAGIFQAGRFEND